MDDAGAALAGVAADMRAGEAEILAQELNQQRARLDVAGDRLAVHGHGHGHRHFRVLPRATFIGGGRRGDAPSVRRQGAAWQFAPVRVKGIGGRGAPRRDAYVTGETGVQPYQRTAKYAITRMAIPAPISSQCL